ncbi:MAG: hypothetical protein A2007_01900 [Verrucomicrobia bacterium GWC2_42_7]|nr:MAG: hypothetical protein A2007_01900 [Verrucomicrobia bacterium GWC2_42_7]
MKPKNTKENIPQQVPVDSLTEQERNVMMTFIRVCVLDEYAPDDGRTVRQLGAEELKIDSAELDKILAQLTAKGWLKEE